MENKPQHFDGSIQHGALQNESSVEPIEITDEARKNISGNPFLSDK